MAASTMPTSSCRLLGSWASPEAKAASASACRPRYWRATPCRKYACRGREGRRVRAAVSVPQHLVYTQTLADTRHFTPFAFFSTWALLGTWHLSPLYSRNRVITGFLYLLIGLEVLHKRTCYTLAGCLLRSNYCFVFFSYYNIFFPVFAMGENCAQVEHWDFSLAAWREKPYRETKRQNERELLSRGGV